MIRWLIPLLFGCAWGLGGLCLRNPELTAGSGGGLLEQVFGGARMALSGQLVQTADVYYHGGVTGVDCPGCAGMAAAQAAPDACPETPHLHGAHGEHSAHAYSADVPSGDWFSRMLARVRPREHRHLSGARYEKEVLPWIWAALKTDPHNGEAALTAAYWLARLGRPDEALRVLERATAGNPQSASLELERGRLLWRTFGRDGDALRAFEAALVRSREEAPQDPARLPEDARRERLRILEYLAACEEARGERDRALRHMESALRLDPGREALRRRYRDLADLPGRKAP